MKKYILLLYCLCLILFNSSRSFSQTPPICDPKSNMSTDGVCSYAEWNWESSECKMWRARLSSNPGVLADLKSPFAIPVGEKLLSIYDQQDFTRARGWELLRRDFGCFGEVGFPYFVLINRFTGLMRVFVYINNINSESFSGIVMTIKPNNDYRTATTSFARELLLTPDKYLTPKPDNLTEESIYVSQATGTSNWVVGEFNAIFDPNIRNNLFDNVSMDIQIFGLINSTIKLEGDYSINSKSGTVSKSETPDGFAKFNAVAASAAKFLKSADEARKTINKTAKNLSDSLAGTDQAFLKSVGKTAGEVAEATNNKTNFSTALSTASSVVGVAVPVIGLIGNVIGMLSSDNSSPVINPYNIKLTGEITTKKIVQTITMRVPGTIHTNTGGGVLPYYDCPLGFFNIKNTPILDRIDYKRVAHYNTYIKKYSTENYISYRVANTPIPIYKGGIGIELVSVQAAIACKITQPWLRNHQLTQPNRKEHTSGNDYNYHINPMLIDFEAGRLIMDKFEPTNGLHVFRTPYVNLECFLGQTFNVPQKYELCQYDVTVRIKAIFKNVNDPNGPPIYYIKDYAVEEVLQPNTYDPSLGFESLPPYTNVTSLPDSYESEININNATYSSNVFKEATYSITCDNVIINPGNHEVKLKAGNSIILKPGFTAKYGSNFNANTNYGFSINCSGPITPEIYTTTCSYNTSAFRFAEEEIKGIENEVIIYPNPSNNIFNIILESKDQVIPKIKIADATGKEVKGIDVKKVSDKSYQVDFKNYFPGIYFIIINQKPGLVVTRKLILH